MKRRIYTGEDLLRLVKRHAAQDLGVSGYRLKLSAAAELPVITVTVGDEGKTMGLFVRYNPARLMAADRIEDGDIVLEDPFYQRGEYPIRVGTEEFRKMRSASPDIVRAEFERLKVKLPPKGWEKRCGLGPAEILKRLEVGV